MTNFKKIKKVAIVGAGTMGSRIAFRCVLKAFETHLFDADPLALRHAVSNIHSWLASSDDIGRQAGETMSPPKNRLLVCNTLAKCVGEVDLVIETVPENLELKRRVFKQIDTRTKSGAYMATNSSSLPCSRIADVTRNPQNVFNINFSDPLQDPLVEIMKGRQTSEETLSAGIDFIRMLEMVPIVTRKEIMGFSFNRIWRAIKHESLYLVDQGYASYEDIDRAWMLEFGTAIGPFGIMDEVGLDVVRDIEMQYYLDSNNIADKPPKLLDDMLAKGQLGVKAGIGFYQYPEPQYKDPDWLYKKGAWEVEHNPE